MSKYDYTIYSDGGSSRGGVAASACVVDGHLSGRRRGAVAFLGEATNNEAEILAALLGFSMVRLAASRREEPGPVRLHWVADSEYTLKSATDYIHNWQRNGWKTASKEPVKNQGLWRAHLYLTKGFKISTEHVRGHTGHPENELCDLAANWAKDCGEDSIEQGLRKVEIPDGELSSWFLVDGREFLAQLREGGEPEEIYTDLERQLEKSFSKSKDSKGDAIEEVSSKKKDIPQEVVETVEELETLRLRLDKFAKNSPEAKKMAKELKALVSGWRESYSF